MFVTTNKDSHFVGAKSMLVTTNKVFLVQSQSTFVTANKVRSGAKSMFVTANSHLAGAKSMFVTAHKVFLVQNQCLHS